MKHLLLALLLASLTSIACTEDGSEGMFGMKNDLKISLVTKALTKQ